MYEDKGSLVHAGALASLHSSFVYTVNSLTSSIIHCPPTPLPPPTPPVITVYMLVALQSQHNTIASLRSYTSKGFKGCGGRTHRVAQPSTAGVMRRHHEGAETDEVKGGM